MSEQLLKTQIVQKVWESAEFKNELLADPKKAIEKAFGVVMPQSLELVAVEESNKKYYLVIPPKPAELTSNDGGNSTQGMW